MFGKQLLTSLRLILMLGAIKADMDTSCIDAPPVKNFEPEIYGGLWYTYAMFDENHKNYDCLLYLMYPREDDGSLPLVKIFKDKNDNSTHIELKNAQIDETGQGETTGTDNYKLTVVGTDYEDYIVTFACEEEANRRIVQVLTSDPEPSYTDLFPVYRIFDRYNMSLYDLRFVDHSNCPDDWSDAQIEAVDFQYDDVQQDLQNFNITRA